MGKSYTLRIFCLLFAVLLAVLCAAGTLIYVFARQTVGEEFLRLNNANLEGTAASMGKSMTEIRSFGQQLSVDSSLLTLADGGTMGERQAISDAVPAGTGAGTAEPDRPEHCGNRQPGGLCQSGIFYKNL